MMIPDAGPYDWELLLQSFNLCICPSVMRLTSKVICGQPSIRLQLPDPVEGEGTDTLDHPFPTLSILNHASLGLDAVATSR